MTRSDSFAVLVDIDGAGAHPAAWRAASAPPDELLTARWITASVVAAERAGFTAVTFEDHPLPADRPGGVTARIDAVIQASFNAPLTGAIGLVPVVQVAYNEPFHVATQLASVDTASHGRAGWIAAADPDPAIAARYGRDALPAGAQDEELADVVVAVRRLWDSWEDDAVIRDTATGRYLDRDRLHYADFEGHRFSVKGPSILPRSPQGQLPVFGFVDTAGVVDTVGVADGASPADTAAEIDVALVDLIEAASGARAQDARRRVVLQLEVVLDRAGQTAAERLAALDAHAPWGASAHTRYVGDAEGLADLLEALADVVDGVRILPAVLDADLDEIGRAVLPLLRDRGVFTSPRVGDTLRTSLGLEHPTNRFVEVSR